jgi:hypothetical protein
MQVLQQPHCTHEEENHTMRMKKVGGRKMEESESWGPEDVLGS